MTTLTGSLINRIGEQSKSETPEVGMGATGFMYSDRIACTVIKVISPSRIVVQRDSCKLEPWPSGYAIDNSYKPDPDGETYTLIKTSKGWKQLKASTRFRLGDRSEYHDPSF